MQWNNFFYSMTYPNVLTANECRGIVDFGQTIKSQRSILGVSRDSDLHWLDVDQLPWLKAKLIGLVDSYNAEYRFEIDREFRMLQLTEYRPGQFYEWHTDLGGGPMSLRKISLVVELQAAEEGGGLEILQQTVRLRPGDAVAFPSFAMHRALPVIRGVRWSLVQWVLGSHPFR